MLFLITMTHTAESCPGYDPEKLEEGIAALEKCESVAKELGVKTHFLLADVLGHTMYALVETDSADALQRSFGESPFRQDYTVTPVGHLKDMIKQAKEMLSEKK
ncbi:unnamed protein product [marine sediment metagenome]|uniref:GYD domain-containing protein n=1 Tax=marine sediment metagenome TaxID=412755 RepID=X1RR01_9ZZZZ